jgi:hypothetical protein
MGSLDCAKGSIPSNLDKYLDIAVSRALLTFAKNEFMGRRNIEFLR